MKTQILHHQDIIRKLKRIAWQIYESNYQETEIVLAGINGNGYKIAQLLAKDISDISGINILLAEIKIDKDKPFNHAISSNIAKEEFNEKTVILVDDVLNSGKTMIYGVKFFLEGPLNKLNTVVLVDRNHHRFPIKSDYTGLRLSTSSQEHVLVVMEEDNYQVFLQ
jgi:pyrimidine operon attenuation protein/uracil phosphoribosyltransferase